MLYLSRLVLALGVSVALSGCGFDRLLGIGGSEVVPPATTTATKAPAAKPVSRDKAVTAATSALGAEVVVRPGEYLLCRTTDSYRERVTHYYTCRERRCVGPEKPALDVKTAKTKSGCLSACRSLETKGKKDAAVRSYCAS